MGGGAKVPALRKTGVHRAERYVALRRGWAFGESKTLKVALRIFSTAPINVKVFLRFLARI